MSMNNNALLEELNENLVSAGLDTEMQEINGQTVLNISCDGNDPLAPEDCTISVENIGDDDETGGTVMQFLFTVFSGMSESMTDDVSVLLMQINSVLSVGGFGVMKDGGYLYLNYAFLTDELDMSGTMISAAAAIEILTVTACRVKEMLLPLINVEKSFEEMQSEDLCISQF